MDNESRSGCLGGVSVVGVGCEAAHEPTDVLNRQDVETEREGICLSQQPTDL